MPTTRKVLRDMAPKETGGFQRSAATYNTDNTNFLVQTHPIALNAQTSYQSYLLDTYRDNRYTKFYAITITPHIHSTTEVFIFNTVYDVINTCKSVISIHFNYECSDAGKLHIHGIIACKDKTKFLKVKKHPICQIHTTEFNPEGNWIQYCLEKSPSIIHTLLRSHSLDNSQDMPIRHLQQNITW